jgi:dissimilatory sulfite reductase (desulfoviridin) alpha/beta subunit
MMSTTWIPPQVDEERCTRCGHCVGICPCQAVTLGKCRPVFSCPDHCPHPETCIAALDGCCLAEEICLTFGGAISRAFEIVPGEDTRREGDLP